MRDEKDQEQEAEARKEAGCEEFAGVVAGGRGAYVDCGAEADERQAHADLDDAEDHARIRTTVSSAAHVGREIAALVRQADSGVAYSVPEFCNVLARMLQAPSSTPLDALAFAVNAKKMAQCLIDTGAMAGEDDRYVLVIMDALMARVVQTLEVASCASADEFTGFVPAIN